MLQKDKDCPMMFARPNPEAAQFEYKCLGKKCGWFRGDEDIPMDTEKPNAGLCSVMQMAGDLGAIGRLPTSGAVHRFL